MENIIWTLIYIYMFKAYMHLHYFFVRVNIWMYYIEHVAWAKSRKGLIQAPYCFGLKRFWSFLCVIMHLRKMPWAIQSSTCLFDRGIIMNNHYRYLFRARRPFRALDPRLFLLSSHRWVKPQEPRAPSTVKISTAPTMPRKIVQNFALWNCQEKQESNQY